MKSTQRSFCRPVLFLATSSLALACGSSNGSTSGTGQGVVGGTTPHADAGAHGAGPGGSDAGAPVADAGADSAPLPVVINYVPGVMVSTLAGSSTSGTQDGTGAAATFDNPTGIAIDASGNLVVTDYDSGHVRLVTPAGVVTTIAASGLVNPFSAAVGADGTYYVGTDANSSGVKDTMTGTVWSIVPPSGGALATPTVAAQPFGRPRGLAPMAGGNLFVMDLTQDVAETVAASQISLLAGAAATPGYVDGTGGSARFDAATGAAARSDGSIVVTDSGNNRVRVISATGVVTTLAGNGLPSLVDGPCASAEFNDPRGVAVDAAGNVYVSEPRDQVIRRITVDCTVQTLAGTGVAGFNDGAGNVAQFYGQEGIAVTPDGSTVYVTDGNGGDGSAYQRVRAITIP